MMNAKDATKKKRAPCPACDVEQHGMKPMMAFAYGVALGNAFIDMHAITELMCREHRQAYVMAMMHASILGNTRDDEVPTWGRYAP